jgi:hypothetical protein
MVVGFIGSGYATSPELPLANRDYTAPGRYFRMATLGENRVSYFRFVVPVTFRRMRLGNPTSTDAPSTEGEPPAHCLMRTRSSLGSSLAPNRPQNRYEMAGFSTLKY